MNPIKEKGSSVARRPGEPFFSAKRSFRQPVPADVQKKLLEEYEAQKQEDED